MKDQKDKQCRFIFTAAFAHIYQGCQYSRLAFNGGSRFFHSRVLPFFPPCLLLLSRLISIEETLSARLSKLENYGFDQLVSQRN